MRPPHPSCRLAPHVHGVAVDEDAVFLDVARDRYVCVPQAAALLRLDAARRVVGVADPGFAEELRRAGLAADGSLDRPLPPPLAPATTSAMSGPFAPPRWHDGLAGVRAMADLARAYWRRPLAQLVGTARDGATGAADTPPGPGLLKTVEGFHRWAPFAPAPGKCLLRSFMLLRLLRRHGHDAHWVFGVRTWPFRAHCWLQRGEVVLDDDLEALVPLTPILVV